MVEYEVKTMHNSGGVVREQFTELEKAKERYNYFVFDKAYCYCSITKTEIIDEYSREQ